MRCSVSPLCTRMVNGKLIWLERARQQWALRVEWIALSFRCLSQPDRSRIADVMSYAARADAGWAQRPHVAEGHRRAGKGRGHSARDPRPLRTVFPFPCELHHRLGNNAGVDWIMLRGRGQTDPEVAMVQDGTLPYY